LGHPNDSPDFDERSPDLVEESSQDEEEEKDEEDEDDEDQLY
jgi:hypothetical protein